MKVFEYIKLAYKYKSDPFQMRYLKGKTVLDIGSGEGHFLSKDPENYVGIDLDPVLVAKCKEKGLNAHCMSAFDLKFPDASFDAVHASQLIEHFTSQDAALFLAEVARVVKPGGFIYITTPGVKNVWNTFSHIRPYPPTAFKKLLNSSTENYIRKSEIDLVFYKAFGARFYQRSKLIKVLLDVFDLIFPPRDPVGWTIILKK